ncbi:MaoC family dehydratase [Roseobacter sp. HKCCA0434]|uniref:MaoC family dehydratase n=1 Tax=Roseobacter sp. HKCCA0434 TaxID=3079297 RepID=UPI002905C869|nr:MaoC family dehydratase [Roseobacter sp. HKCCA0434]
MTVPHRRSLPVATLQACIGQEVGLSDWIAVGQDRIDAFAQITEDDQFIHTDPQAAAATPFGGTIAHGFLTLSLLSAMAYDAVPVPEGAAMGVNYGFDRVRFLSPVRAGARVRGRFVLSALDVTGPEITQRLAVTVEIEGADKPALAADWITRSYLSPGG